MLLISLCILLLISCSIGISVGSTEIGIFDVLKLLANQIGYEYDLSRSTIDIIMLVRGPRVICALLLGIGLAYSGVVMQAVVQNPIADPYILGVSSGAYLGAVLSIMLGVGKGVFGFNAVGFSAFIGALVISILVLLIARVSGEINKVRLLFVGMAFSLASQSIANFIVFYANDREKMRTITYWTMGSLGGANWETNGTLLIIVLLGLYFFIKFNRILDLMLLGDVQSMTLGINLAYYRILFIVAISVVIGYAVNVAGIIGFVGLIVPHFTRMLVGVKHKWLLIISSLMGAVLFVWADILSRILIANTEVPIGIIISLIGSPLFIYLLIKKK